MSYIPFDSTDIPITVKVSISSAEILNLNSVPKELVAAPGAGKVIQVLNIVTKLNYGTAAYATNTSINFYAGGANIFASLFAFLAETTNRIVQISPYNAAVNTTDSGAVTAKANGGNPTTGDGTLDVYVTYKVITL